MNIDSETSGDRNLIILIKYVIVACVPLYDNIQATGTPASNND
jgi:hypothetical protein